MQKKRAKNWMSTALLLALVCLALPAGGSVARAQTPGNFSIHAVIPENQVDTKQTYFDLRMKPNETQTIQFVITNSKAEELVADVRLCPATTGRNGLIVYTEPETRPASGAMAITDVVEAETRSVSIPANSSQTIDLHIKMPAQPFDGVILGGIAVTENTAGTPAAQGVSLKNTITYVIALKLSENDNEAAPDFDLTAITPNLVNYRTAVTVTLQNKAARIVKDMAVTAQIYRKDTDTVLHELTLNGAEMAPLTQGDFVIDWEGEALKPGTYRLSMNAVYAGRTWKWDEEFIIGGEADSLNKEAVNTRTSYTWLYLLLGFALLVLIALLAYWMGKRRKNPKT